MTRADVPTTLAALSRTCDHDKMEPKKELNFTPRLDVGRVASGVVPSWSAYKGVNNKFNPRLRQSLHNKSSTRTLVLVSKSALSQGPLLPDRRMQESRQVADVVIVAVAEEGCAASGLPRLY
ncbi:hypothetical protein MRX96_009262 [Rhipicephalus microplus]